jgi:peroxiredoxin
LCYYSALSGGPELGMLRQVVLLALVVAPATAAQNVPELTKQTSEHYRTLQSFEVGGRLTAVIPGTKLVFHAQTVNAAAGPSFVSVKNKASKLVEVRSFRESKITDEEGRKRQAPFEAASITMPSGFGEYEKLSEGIRTAKELPHEVLKVDGSPVECSVLGVEYDRPERKPEEQTVKYWIDAKRLIVLKQEFSEFQRHNKKTVLWHWVYQVDSVKLNQPPPEWLTELLKKRDDAGHDRPEWIGRGAPPFSLLDLDGRQVTLAAMRGKVFVLDFWATWCGPCIAEMPTLETIEAEYKAKGVELWGVSSEEPSAVKKWLNQNQKTLKTLVDAEGDTSEEYDVEGIPALVVIGRDGKIRSYYIGNQTEQSLRTAIEAALRGSVN